MTLFKRPHPNDPPYCLNGVTKATDALVGKDTLDPFFWPTSPEPRPKLTATERVVFDRLCSIYTLYTGEQIERNHD